MEALPMASGKVIPKEIEAKDRENLSKFQRGRGPIKPEYKELPDSASFLLDEDCNLRCTYCFENHSDCERPHMSKKTMMRGLEYLAENAVLSGKGHFHAMLFGGEPLLRPKLMEQLFEYGLSLGRKYNIRFSASMVTNATILTDKIFKMLKKYRDKVNLNIQLSVDGIKEVHDMYRITKLGNGSFDMIEKNIPKFQELFADSNQKKLAIHGCINRKTLPYLFENFRFFKEDWGFDSIWFMPIHEEEWTEEDVDLYEEQLTKISDYLLEKAKEIKSPQAVEWFSPISKCLTPANGFSNVPCGAGRGFITITAKGDIYPCHHFYFNHPEKLKIGNIWDGIDEPKRTIYLEYSNQDMTCDKNCDHYHCYRCIAVNYDVHGSILSQVRGIYCKMSKVEKRIQDKVREELIKMGLINNPDPNNPNFNGKLHKIHKLEPNYTFKEAWLEGNIYKELYNWPDGGHIVLQRPAQAGDRSIIPGKKSKKKQHECNCGDDNKHECNCGGKEKDNSKDLEVISMALKLIISELDQVKSTQKEILRLLSKE